MYEGWKIVKEVKPEYASVYYLIGVGYVKREEGSKKSARKVTPEVLFGKRCSECGEKYGLGHTVDCSFHVECPHGYRYYGNCAECYGKDRAAYL